MHCRDQIHGHSGVHYSGSTSSERNGSHSSRTNTTTFVPVGVCFDPTRDANRADTLTMRTTTDRDNVLRVGSAVTQPSAMRRVLVI